MKRFFSMFSRMDHYFRIIHIRKYYKQIFITFVTKVQGLNNHQYLRFRHQRLDILARKICEIYSFFPEISSLTSNQCPCSYIMSCTYVTTFNKCFNLVVKPANSIILYNMSKTIPNMQDIQQQQMFSYILLK